MGAREDVYAHVTGKIVADLERGVRPWERPWSSDYAGERITRPLRHNGKPYRGINILLLWGAALEKGYQSSIWMTFRQASKELGAHVRKGEKGTLVVFADNIKKTETDEETGEENECQFFYMKSYSVFNVEQIEGLPERFYHKPEQIPEGRLERDERLNQFFVNTGASIRHGGGKAYYSMAGNYVGMPLLDSFRDMESYYATLAHEVTHWTRHPIRLEREFGRKKWGDEGYAKEELVAEMGAAFLCADLRITPETREDHAAYIQSWLKALKNDARFIFVAASYAQQAIDFLQGLQLKPDYPADEIKRSTGTLNDALTT